MNFADYGIEVDGRGEQRTLCPQCSGDRKKRREKCLAVNVDDGVWQCHHCGWTGALQKDRQRAASDKPRAYVRPSLSFAGLNEGATQWLQSRGITRAVAERNRLTVERVFMPQTGAEVSALCFPYLRGGEVINAKYRSRDKHFRMASGAELLLYGFDDMAERTIIVEGEMDKLACEVAGFPNTVSVPNGAPPVNAKNVDGHLAYLADAGAVKEWVIAVDNDAPGQRLQEELIRRLGPERCRVVVWPDGCKDANDALLQAGTVGLRRAIEAAQPVPIVGVFSAEDFGDEFSRMYDEGMPSGLSTGWEAIDNHWRVAPGQLLVVTGIPGHGKSEWVDSLVCNLATLHGWRAAYYTPENYPVRLHMLKLAEKVIGKPYNPGPHERMSPSEVADARDWMQAHIRWIMPEAPSLDEIIDKARALVLRDGIRVLVIDPWNEVEHNRPAGMTEAEYVSESLRKLRMFARKHELLLIVVAHPRLLEKRADGTYPVPTPYDISGGANWRNKADNCVTVYADPTDKDGRVEIHVQKVKFKLFGQVGMVPMRWDRLTGRYFGRQW